ncbi:MAG: DUF4893 domain-containing protein [Sphingomonas sp.]|uniref:DUF4893 domain-containing protein n=1 Tax=Sphingomonas sp. TaxID=28214 RepID=UPI001AC5FB02|nr:DUF4893 domain-containing protein [Sphingomonas sp.]MBN8806833.1 DUF4893 domain-containing protein [Sphingomonas sp.]
MTALRWAMLAGLALVAAPAAARDSVPTNWRNVVAEHDAISLRNTRQAWIDALAKARAGGAGARIAAEGALFDFDRAQPKVKLPVGEYRCRVFKLGAKAAGNLDFVAYPWAHCQVTADGPLTHLTKLDGAQRQDGRLYDDGTARQVFLGTLALADETKWLTYGRDTLRDVAGMVERVGPARWRIAIPYPKFESMLDVIELVPAS